MSYGRSIMAAPSGAVESLAMLNADKVRVNVTVGADNTLVVTNAQASVVAYSASATAGRLAAGSAPCGAAFMLAANATVSRVVVFFDSAPGVDTLIVGLTDADASPNIAVKTVTTDANTPPGAFTVVLDSPVALVANHQYLLSLRGAAAVNQVQLAPIAGVTLIGQNDSGQNCFAYGGIYGIDNRNTGYAVMLELRS